MSHMVSKYLLYVNMGQCFANPFSRGPLGIMLYIMLSLSTRLCLPEVLVGQEESWEPAGSGWLPLGNTRFFSFPTLVRFKCIIPHGEELVSTVN